MRIGTWNLENLFLAGENGGPHSQADYDTKLDALAAKITEIGVEVLGVQEVGSPEAFDDLVSRLGPGWQHHLADPAASSASHPIRVGVLSRHDVTVVDQIATYQQGLPDVVVNDAGATSRELSRPDLHVRIAVPSEPALDMVICHFKSKLLSFTNAQGDQVFDTTDEDQRARAATYALARRAAEAATTRGIATRVLDGHGQERRLLMCGDLNDTEYSATTSLLAGPGGSEIGTGGFDQPDQGDGRRLWNLGLAIPADQRFSRRYQGRGELIDHLFVSHALLAGLGTVTAHDVGPVSVTDTPGHPSVAAGHPRPPSDHRPVTADIAL